MKIMSPKIIGLTGSIGMGKSVTASLLREMGIPVHDSDACVHGLLMPGQIAYASVVQEFGSDILNDNKTIDRQKLGRLVFGDDEQKKILEDILHPWVRQSQADFITAEKGNGQKAVILDIPLLYETGAETRCDFVICVTAPRFIQRARVLKRQGMTPLKFAAISASQISNREKCRRADFVVQTWLGRRFAKWQLKKILHKIGI